MSGQGPWMAGVDLPGPISSEEFERRREEQSLLRATHYVIPIDGLADLVREAMLDHWRGCALLTPDCATPAVVRAIEAASRD